MARRYGAQEGAGLAWVAWLPARPPDRQRRWPGPPRFSALAPPCVCTRLPGAHCGADLGGAGLSKGFRGVGGAFLCRRRENNDPRTPRGSLGTRPQSWVPWVLPTPTWFPTSDPTAVGAQGRRPQTRPGPPATCPVPGHLRAGRPSPVGVTYGGKVPAGAPSAPWATVGLGAVLAAGSVLRAPEPDSVFQSRSPSAFWGETRGDGRSESASHRRRLSGRPAGPTRSALAGPTFLLPNFLLVAVEAAAAPGRLVSMEMRSGAGPQPGSRPAGPGPAPADRALPSGVSWVLGPRGPDPAAQGQPASSCVLEFRAWDTRLWCRPRNERGPDLQLRKLSLVAPSRGVQRVY